MVKSLFSNHKRPMNKRTESDSSWRPCPAGTLSQLGAREAARQGRRARRTWISTGLGLGAVAVMAVVSWSVADGMADRKVDIPVVWHCDAVLEHVDLYLTKDLAQPSRAEIEHHLKHCPHCHRRYQRRADQLGLELGLAAAIPLLHAPPRAFSVALHTISLFAVVHSWR